MDAKPRSRGSFSFVVPGALLVMAVLLFFWPLVLGRHLPVPNDVGSSDLNAYHLPGRAYLARALATGRFPVWIDGLYGGFPFVGAVEFSLLHPLTLLCYGLCPLVLGHAFHLLAIYVLAAWGVYLLCRRLGGTPWGAVLAAVALSFSGPFVMHLRLINMILAAAHLPWLFWALEGFLRTGKRVWAVLLAGIFALQILAGHPQISHMSLLALVGWFFLGGMGRGEGEGERRGGARRPGERLALLSALLLLAACMGAVQILPTWELKEMCHRGGDGVSWDFARAYAYPPGDVLTFVIPYVWGDAGTRSYFRGIHWENHGYVGLLPLLLGLGGGLLLLRRDAVMARLLVLGLGAFLLVLGPATPVFALAFHLVPGMAMFRFPQRWLFVVDLALALMAGLAWSAAARRLPRRRGLAGLVLVVLVFADLAVHHRRQVPLHAAADWLAAPAAVQAIRAERAEGRLFTVGAVESHLRAYREARGWQGDLGPYLRQLDMLQVNTPILHELSTTDGYMNLVPRHLAAFLGHVAQVEGLVQRQLRLARQAGRPWAEDPVLLRLLAMRNTRWILAATPRPAPGLELVGRAGTAWLHRLAACLPRARIVGRARVLKDDEAVARGLVSPDFDPRETVLLSGELPVSTGREEEGKGHAVRAGRAEIVEDDGETLLVRADLVRPGFLVLADTWYPGWTVTVDGAPAEILRADLCSRAVALGPGTHAIRFRFRSPTLRWGFALSAAACLIWLLLLVRSLRRP